MTYNITYKDKARGSFIWDEAKEVSNIHMHGMDFTAASLAFYDPQCIIAIDEPHSHEEERFFCIGKIMGRIATVRFTYRGDKIRIIGAGYWRKGRKFYERKYATNS